MTKKAANKTRFIAYLCPECDFIHVVDEHRILTDAGMSFAAFVLSVEMSPTLRILSIGSVEQDNYGMIIAKIESREHA